MNIINAATMATKLISVRIVTAVKERRGNHGCVAICDQGHLYLVYIQQNDDAVRMLNIDDYLTLRNVDVSDIDDAITPPTKRLRISSRSKVNIDGKYSLLLIYLIV